VYGIVQRREDEAEAEIKYGKAEKAEYVIKDKIGVRGGDESCRASGNSRRRFVRVERTMRGRASGERQREGDRDGREEESERERERERQSSMTRRNL